MDNDVVGDFVLGFRWIMEIDLSKLEYNQTILNSNLFQLYLHYLFQFFVSIDHWKY